MNNKPSLKDLTINKTSDITPALSGCKEQAAPVDERAEKIRATFARKAEELKGTKNEPVKKGGDNTRQLNIMLNPWYQERFDLIAEHHGADKAAALVKLLIEQEYERLFENKK